MKSILKTSGIALLAASVLTSCFKEPDTQGYIGDGIRLQGSDTMYVAIGTKVASSSAWLDNSTRPCTFVIENVRDEAGNRADGFFQEFPTRMWVSPYDYMTDKTWDDVMKKLTDINVTPLMINSTNGQLRAMASTAKIGLQAGEIYHVDVKVSNSKGTVHLKDYAILKLEAGSGGESAVNFELTDLVNGICIQNAAGENTFPYYDAINASADKFSERRENIYADNGKERNMAVRKVSDEPEVGIKVTIKLLDKNGKLFNPADYASYSTLTSYIDYSVNRVDDPEKGMIIEFPYTPWPVGLEYSYFRGTSYTDFSNLDVTNLKADNLAKRIPISASWPSDDYAGFKSWYVRVRSNIKFYQPGSYEIVMKVPYTTVK